MFMKIGFRPLLAGVSALVILLSLTVAQISADVIICRNGNRLEGKITYSGEKEVWLESPTSRGKVTIKLQRSSISSISLGETYADKLEKMYSSRASKLNKSSAVEWFRLGLWCEKHKLLTRRAVEAFRKATEIDPQCAAAHLKLGHVKYEGVWMAYDEMMLCRGYVKVHGKWMTVEAKMALLLKEKEIELLQAKKAADEATTRRLDAERRLVEAASRKPEPPRVVERNSVIVERRIYSPIWWGYPRRVYPYPVTRGYSIPQAYWIMYPYRRGYRSAGRCGGVYIHYERSTPRSRLKVGFIFK